jgi:hypothetical protein
VLTSLPEKNIFSTASSPEVKRERKERERGVKEERKERGRRVKRR